LDLSVHRQPAEAQIAAEPAIQGPAVAEVAVSVSDGDAAGDVATGKEVGEASSASAAPEKGAGDVSVGATAASQPPTLGSLLESLSLEEGDANPGRGESGAAPSFTGAVPRRVGDVLANTAAVGAQEPSATVPGPVPVSDPATVSDAGEECCAVTVDSERLKRTISHSEGEESKRAILHSDGSADVAGAAGGTQDEEEAPGAVGGAAADDAELIKMLLLQEQMETMYAVIPLPGCPHMDSVCQVPARGIDAHQPCGDCADSGENWLCLTCYQVYCGRYRKCHMVEHGNTSGHKLVLSLADLSVWCYRCQAYVHHERLIPAKRAAHRSKFGEDMPC